LRVELYPEFIALLDAAKTVIARRSVLLWQRSDEPDPLNISLSFRPVIAEKIVHQALDRNACVACERRISYKKDQFAPVTPVEPYLVLVHNDFLGPRAAYYNDPAENALFEKMFEGVLGFSPRAALVREILRCHFSKEDTGSEGYLANCMQHVRRDIEHAGVRGILLMGKAASFVFRDKAELAARQNKVFEWQNLPTMLCPGPNRLTYMREKNFPVEQINAERQNIFAVLTMFRDQIIGAGPTNR